MTRALPVIVLQGSPQERGRQHGARFAAEIQTALARLRAEHSAAAFDAARQRATQAWPLITDQAAAVAAEIDGMADGAGVDATLLLLNIGFEFFSTPATTGCSAVALTAPGGALVAQNWDAPGSAIDELALFLHVGPSGFEQAMIASIGGLGWVGCNCHGLAFVNNDMLMRQAGAGLPSQIVRRLILAEADVPAATRRLTALQHMGGRSYVLGDAAGRVAAVEVSAHGAKIQSQSAPVFHTNHALQTDIRQDEDEAALQRIYPSSRERHAALLRHAAALSGPGSIKILLANEDGAPDSICKTASAREPTETVFSVLFDCGRREIHLCAGAPARNSYVTLALPAP